MARVLQCVASRGVRSRVRAITRSTSASVILRGAPGRGSSSSPGNRFRTKRCRQRPTVCRVTPAVAAISPLVLVEAHARTRRARWAKPCAVVGRRAHCSSVCRSSAVSTTGGVGRPVRIDVLRVYTKNVGAHQFVPPFSTQDTRICRDLNTERGYVPAISREPTYDPEIPVYILLALSLLLFVPKLGMPLLDPDEGLYAEIAREMLTSGDWVIPHVNGLPYLEKPPLYFWLTALTFQLFGPSEWATRLWSAISALGTVLLTWRIGRRLYGAPAGLMAGVVVATVVGNALYVRRASTDQLFVFCLTLAMYGFLRDAERPDRGRARFLLLYLGAALGVLAKGFLGVVFPVLIMGLGLATVRRAGPRSSVPLRWRELNLVRGTALFAVIAVPWHALVAWRSPMLFYFYVVHIHMLLLLH